jgi:hypothetical protein
MIALLPLRAMAGDWMLFGMAAEATSGGLSVVMPDCDMHLSQPAGQGDPERSPTADGQCGWCALCYPVAGHSSMGQDLPFDLPQARPRAGDDGFVSATTARNLRPPTS